MATQESVGTLLRQTDTCTKAQRQEWLAVLGEQ